MATALPRRGGAAAAIEDRWILSRLDGLVRRVNRAFGDYVYNEAASALYQFTCTSLRLVPEIVKPLAAADASGDAARGPRCSCSGACSRCCTRSCPS